MPRPQRFLLLLIAFLLPPSATFGATTQWHASSGAYPDLACPWSLFDNASPEAPALSQGYKMTLATSDASENMYYEQTGSLAIPSLFTISARFRVISESHLADNPRRGVAIGFAVAPDKANFLWVGQDEVFLWSAYAVQGPTASVDTDDAFHTYDIEVASQNWITVYQDSVMILTGSIVGTGGNIAAPTINWGDITFSSYATSEWVSFVHNANTTPCGAEPVPPTLRINDVSVFEGNNAVFTVSLNHRTDTNVTGSYETEDGTATTADNDYVAASGPLTIPAGALSTTLAVQVNADDAPEFPETLFVIVSNVADATIADDVGVGTIRTDDAEVVNALSLAWDACPGAAGGGTNEVFDCAGTGFHMLYGSFRVPVAIAQMNSFQWDMDIATDSATLPPFWDLNGCNAGNVEFTPVRPALQCPGTQSTWSSFDSHAMFLLPLGENRAKLMGYALFTDFGMDLDPGEDYFAFRLKFLLDEAVERGGACSGCTTPVCIRLNNATLATYAGDTYHLRGPGPFGNQAGVNTPSTFLCEQAVDVRPVPTIDEISSTAWPNPFRSDVTVEFGVPTGTLARMEVFDILGRRVRRAEPVYLPGGRQRLVWDGRSDDGHIPSAGVYLVRVSGLGLYVVRRVIRMN